MTYRKIGGHKKKASGAAKKTIKRRRRRVSGTGDIGGMLEKAGGLIVGAVAARELNTLGAKMAPTIFTPMISGIIQMGVGFFLPKIVKGSFFQNMGDGMIANGGMVAIVSTGVISGLPSSQNDAVSYRIAGTSNIPAITGMGQKAIAGTGNINTVTGPLTRVQNFRPGTPFKIPALSY